MREVSIGSAALRLRRSYNQVYRLILLGEVKGEQREDGRWIVDGEDLDRFCDKNGLPATRSTGRSAA